MPYLAAALSAVIWGSGQLFNKQKIKALVFFLCQAVLVLIELGTGSWHIITGQAEPTFRNAGMFIKGMWGLITLGEIPRTNSSVKVYDHSTMLLVAGLLSLVFLMVFAIIFVWNVRDAYKTRKKIKAGEIESSTTYFKKVLDNSFEYFAIAPGVLLVTIFSVVPILFSILVVFTNYNNTNIPPKSLVSWTGFKTLADIINLPVWSKTFLGILVWTVIWAFLATFSNYIVGFFQAVILNSKQVRFAKAWRSLFILPWAIPAFISMRLFKNLLVTNGAFNRLLLDAGIIDQAIPFLSSVGWSRASLVMVNVWLGFPYAMALISGIMTTINTEIYEAAAIDGANAYHQLKSITIPTIVASIAPLIILSVTHNFNNFGMIYFVTEGGPANKNYLAAGSTDILITWIYKLTLDQRMYNYAAAMSILVFFIIASVSGWNLRRTRAFKED